MTSCVLAFACGMIFYGGELAAVTGRPVFPCWACQTAFTYLPIVISGC